MTTAERFENLFGEPWDINPFIAIIMILVSVYFVGKLVAGMFVGNSDYDSSFYEPPTPEEIEVEKRHQKEQEETDTAVFLAYQAYRLEQWKSTAVCGHCLRKTLAQDEESDKPHYCEYYHGFSEP